MTIERYKELHERYHASKVEEEEFEGELRQSSKERLIELILTINSTP